MPPTTSLFLPLLLTASLQAESVILRISSRGTPALAAPLYSGTRELAPAGTPVVLRGSTAQIGAVLVRNTRVLAKRKKTRVLLLEGETEIPTTRAPAPGRVILPAGTSVRVLLLEPLSAKKNRAGDAFRARLLEPVRLGGNAVVPEGALVTGRVKQRIPPRRLRRAGLLAVEFQALHAPDTRVVPLSATLASAERGIVLDREGAVRGGPQSKKALLLSVAISYAAGKLVDDLLEEGVKAGLGAASAGAAATAARYVGIGVGVGLFLAGRGQDARLPQYSELEIVLSRQAPLDTPPLTLAP